MAFSSKLEYQVLPQGLRYVPVPFQVPSKSTINLWDIFCLANVNYVYHLFVQAVEVSTRDSILPPKRPANNHYPHFFCLSDETSGHPGFIQSRITLLEEAFS